MTNTFLEDATFESELENYIANRMYPQGHRKESPMIALSIDHLNAVCHAEFYLHKTNDKFLEPHMRTELENDLLRLAELKMFIIKYMTTPPRLFWEDN